MALARAVVFKPDILLLDEPLGALDRKLREELQVELKQLQRRLGRDDAAGDARPGRGPVAQRPHHGPEPRQDASRSRRPPEAYLRPANRFVAEFLGIANFVGLDGGRNRRWSGPSG